MSAYMDLNDVPATGNRLAAPRCPPLRVGLQWLRRQRLGIRQKSYNATASPPTRRTRRSRCQRGRRHGDGQRHLPDNLAAGSQSGPRHRKRPSRGRPPHPRSEISPGPLHQPLRRAIRAEPISSRPRAPGRAPSRRTNRGPPPQRRQRPSPQQGATNPSPSSARSPNPSPTSPARGASPLTLQTQYSARRHPQTLPSATTINYERRRDRTRTNLSIFESQYPSPKPT